MEKSRKEEIRLSDHFTYGKLLRFVLPSIIMMVFTSIYGVVDGLFVSNFAGKESFAAINLVMPFIMVLGGMGSMLGSILSATVLTILPEATRSFDSYRMVIYSLVLILMMIFRPGGLLGSYDFSLSRVVEKIMNGELFKKNKEKEGADHE